MPYGMGPAGGGTVLMGTVEGGVGIPGGTEHPFLHEVLRRRKKKFGFWKGRQNFFRRN